MNTEPLTLIANPHARQARPSAVVYEYFPAAVFRATREFHRQIPGYSFSPLKSLDRLASLLGVGGIWIKDESVRLDLNSFKVLGSSFAIYQFIKSKLGVPGELTYAELTSPEVHARLGQMTFAAATDGNHGRGVAWASKQLGCQAVIYVHKQTSQARIRAIEKQGARVHVVDGTYDDAVRQVVVDAHANGWQIISDTSWDGYQDVPRWVMQGYTTMLSEAQQQLAAQGIVQPTHIFVQAGVGALAAATLGYYNKILGADQPISVVVEPTAAASLFHSAQVGDGQPHSVGGDLNTIMAGLACDTPSPLAWRVIWDCADAFIASPDYVAAKGMRVYAVPLRGDPMIVSGESGAVTLGALMYLMQAPQYREWKQRLRLGPDSQVLLINSEGNTDPEYFRLVAWEGANPVPAEHRWRPEWAAQPG